MQTKHITFVCAGNCTRSPLAECCLKKMLKEAGIEGIEVSSVGTVDWGRNPRDPRMASIAAEHGYVMTGETTYMTPELLNQATHVVIMSESMRNPVTSVLKFDHWERIVTFMQYAYGQEGGVTDPSGGAESMYRHAFDVIEKGCDRIIERLKNEQCIASVLGNESV